MITVYGITNCDSVKKARAWLAAHGQAHTFHDFKKHGVPPDALARWVQASSWETLLNRRGTTWRALDAESLAGAADAAGAQRLMRAHPSLIKRPVVDWGNAVTVGFEAQDWARRV